MDITDLFSAHSKKLNKNIWDSEMKAFQKTVFYVSCILKNTNKKSKFANFSRISVKFVYFFGDFEFTQM